jgi:hypothetical protein
VTTANVYGFSRTISLKRIAHNRPCKQNSMGVFYHRIMFENLFHLLLKLVFPTMVVEMRLLLNIELHAPTNSTHVSIFFSKGIPHVFLVLSCPIAT